MKGIFKFTIRHFILTIVIMILTFIGMLGGGFFLSKTDIGKRFLESSSLKRLSIIDGVVLEKPDGWLMWDYKRDYIKNTGYFELKRYDDRKVKAVIIVPFTPDDMPPDIEGQLSAENISIGQAYVRETEKQEGNLSKSHKDSVRSYNRSSFNRYIFKSFQPVDLNHVKWGEYTTKIEHIRIRKATRRTREYIWKLFYTTHNNHLIFFNYRYKGDEIQKAVDEEIRKIIGSVQFQNNEKVETIDGSR